MRRALTLSTLLFMPTAASLAGEADVLKVDVSCSGETCRFSVTVAHSDEGWDHYADKWEVLDADGTVIATRELAHPHVDEQPFTRSLGGVKIPADLDRVTVRAHDSVHGYGGGTLTVEIPR
ncbi:MAG: hypothetical protein U5R46_14640 [Gammaproteobacteria bacterium]|nr:hypothetical protein [Gammaproteobacteria bacterium]